jgi:hypothetical protein
MQARYCFRSSEVAWMTIRTSTKTVSFRRPFWLKGVDRLLPPADYRVVTDEELIEGLSFSAYHRVSTVIFVPAPSGSAIEMVTIDPLDLEAALERDAARPPPANELGKRVPVTKDRNCSLAFCPFVGPSPHAIQPSSLALSLASFQAARNSDTVIANCGTTRSMQRSQRREI